MQKPDYKNGGIVNLMSSIGAAFDAPSRYGECVLLPAEELKSAKTVVLMVFDGMGYGFLKERESVFHEGLRGKITSIYPPTTSAAITTFMTGVAPQQHAINGWFMYLKEVGMVSTILLFRPRAGGEPYSAQGISFSDITPLVPLSDRMDARAYHITRNDIKDSDYNKAVTKNAIVLGYDTLNGFFAQTKNAIAARGRRKYVYAYWPGIDTLIHEHGTESAEVKRHFRDIDKKFRAFLKSIEGTGVAVIVTADHGLVDTPAHKVIRLADHPKLEECLTLPLCGDSRTKYCYVHPKKAKQFEAYVKTRLKAYCDIYPSDAFIKKGYFGTGVVSPRLGERAGDYVLCMKENYILFDEIAGEERHVHIGNHGGGSAREMFVPLIVFKG